MVKLIWTTAHLWALLFCMALISPAHADLAVNNGVLQDDSGKTIALRASREPLYLEQFRGISDTIGIVPESPELLGTEAATDDASASLRVLGKVRLSSAETTRPVAISSTGLKITVPTAQIRLPTGITAKLSGRNLVIMATANTKTLPRTGSVVVLGTASGFEGSVVVGITQDGAKTSSSASNAAIGRIDAPAIESDATASQPINWRLVARSMQASASSGNNAVRIVVIDAAPRTGSGAELTQLIQLCRRQALICILSVVHDFAEPDGTAAVALADYATRPDIHASLYGTQDAVILDVANPSQALESRPAAASSLRQSIVRLRASGLNHTLLVTAPVSKTAAGALIEDDPNRNIVLQISRDDAALASEFEAPTISAALPTLEPRSTSTRRTLTVNGNQLSVNPSIFKFAKNPGMIVLPNAVSFTGSATPQTQLTANAFGHLSIGTSNLRIDVPENLGTAARSYSPFLVIRRERETVTVKVALDIGQDK